MTNTPSTHWASVGEAGFIAGMKLLYAINRFLGRWPFRVALVPVVFWYLLTRRLARRSSREYLERLEAHTGALGRPPTWRDVFRHLVTFSESLLDKALAVGGRYPLDRLSFEGREVMLESLASRRGGVLLTCHMGTLEVCRLGAERRENLRLNVLVHTRHAARFNTLLQRLDSGSQIRLLQVTELDPAAAAMLSDRVDRGEFVVIAADRVPVAPGGRTVTVPFLGAPAAFPLGPWALAAALKCQVILFAVIHQGDGYRVSFERLAERIDLPRTGRDAAAKPYIQRYASWLEALCRRSPYDWFNFYPFWSAPRA
jgi:predicted LPLAT superfamily acyltransferase